MSLEGVLAFRVSPDLVQSSNEALQEAGAEGFEMFVLWTGVSSGEAFDVQHVYSPAQRSFRGERGVHVRVGGNELHKLNRWLYENGQVLAIQIHTHPTGAYHSETDDAFPMVTTLGGLSIVVPDFCRQGIGCLGTAYYRLTIDGWIDVSPQADSLLQVAS